MLWARRTCIIASPPATARFTRRLRTSPGTILALIGPMSVRDLLPKGQPKSRPTCISLFAGGGGMSLGLERAGFDVLFATDIDQSSAKTFAANRPDLPFVCRDIGRIERAEVEALVAGRKVDLVSGGPPCQGFSTMGDQILADPRNALFWAFRRIVEWVGAECFLMENVAYLRSQYGGKYEREIVEAFEALGFRVSVTTLNAADYGVPQVRRRVMFFGTKRPSKFAWPVASHAEHSTTHLPPWVTVGQAINDLAETSGRHEWANHEALRHSRIVTRRYELIPEGGRLPPPSELPPEIRRKNFGNTYKRLHRDRPSLTLVPGNNAFPVHPFLLRSLTPREAARLQSFPDDFIFAGNRSQQCRLVGNAVPPKLAEALGQAIATHLASNEIETNVTPALRQAPPNQLSLPLASLPQRQRLARSKRTPAMKRTALSFFTGSGGLTLGFVNAGYRILGSFDRKTIVAKNLALNFPEMPHVHEDIRRLSADAVRRMVGSEEVDVIFGGSPCQGFSIFGRRRFVRTEGHSVEADERNLLTLDYVRLAVALAPRAIVLENVKGIVSAPYGRTTFVDAVERRLRRAGYCPQWRVLNCADFGVPQLRERFLMVAVREDIEFRWPEPKFFAEPKSWQRRHATVGDVITDLMDPRTASEDFSHVAMDHKPMVVERYRLIPEGGRLPEKDLPRRLQKGYRTERVKNFSHVFRRLAMNRPATTMVPGHNAFPVHPLLPRTLTVREAARIQTFPDWMKFTGTRQQQCMLVGNAVPPAFAGVLAQALNRALDGVYKDPGYKRDIYDLRTG